jgi:hypothetical protein
VSDINSSLPVRTENAGDIASKIVDATTPSQGLGVDTSGRITIKLTDGAGNAVTSQVNGAQRALDVGINVAGVQIDPRAIRALTATDVVTANQGTAAATHASPWWIAVTDGTSNVAIKAASTAAAAIDPSFVVALSPNSPLPAGTNSIGKVAQDNTVQWLTKDLADGSATGGTAGSFSMLTGGLYNAALPTLTAGQQSAFQLDSSGRLIIRPLVAATDSVTSRLQDGAGNALTSSAAGGTRPLDVALRDSSGNLYSAANPMPVQLAPGEAGSEIHNYNTAAALAAGASSNHDYAITATKTFKATKFWSSATGKLKIEVQVSLNGTTFTTRFVGFNSTSNPNITIDLGQFTLSDTGTGAIVRIIRTNYDKAAMDVYSTISGIEV